jgi:hypothetical protein
MEYPKNAFAIARPLTAAETVALRMRPRSFVPSPEVKGWRDILYQAADIIEHVGWCRRTLTRRSRHCAVGAIIAACNRGDVPSRFADLNFATKRDVHLIIRRVQLSLHQDLARWNDNNAKSGRHVAALLRFCAEHEAAQKLPASLSTGA